MRSRRYFLGALLAVGSLAPLTAHAQTGSIRGHRTVGERGERWRGTFRLKILVTRKGRYVDTCRTGRLRFTLRPV